MKGYKIFLLLALVTNTHVFAQADGYPLGQVIESVPVREQAGESFALYLPAAFKSDEASPVVFVFDPVGNGPNGLQGFLEAAETYGYILVCSNNSRNGPYDRNFEIAGRLFDQVLTEFAIDPDRIYTSGFSGGSRLASAIADLAGKP